MAHWYDLINDNWCLRIIPFTSPASMFLDILIITADTLLQGFLIEEEFERNAKKGRGITRERSHAQKSVRSVLDKTQSFKEGKYAKANIFDPDLQQDNSEL